MKSSFRRLLAPAVLATTLVLPLHGADSGHFDFGKLVGPEKGEFVDITLGRGVLKFASIVAKCKNAEASQLISGLSRIRVNVVGLDDSNRRVTTDRVEAIRKELVSAGWEPIVTVRGKRQEDVAVFVKQRDGETIDGLVVTVIDERKKEAVFVNVVGNIRADQLAALGEQFDIPHLRGTKKVEKS